MEDRTSAGSTEVVITSHHARALHAAAVAVDRLLADVESLLGPGESPVRRAADDLSPAQKQVLSALVQSIHTRMNGALERLGVPPALPTGSARASASTAFTFAEVALQEVEPERLRGYGVLPADAAAAIEAMLADVGRSIAGARSFLLAPARADLAARIAKLELSAEREEISRLEQRVRDGGLVALRRPLEALVEQLESGTYEVAFFGRVSSGKSSLLNAFVDRSVLPVGVTPVTSVPTRIVWGGEPTVLVRCGEVAHEERLPLDRLADFVTEEHNPGNAKHVLRIALELPAERLLAGITLVDTPGLSALASAGARETFAYLPRCDLGVVVIDGGSAIEAADVDVIRTLRDSGIDVEVVLSKADRLAENERAAFAGYVSSQLVAYLGANVEPRWVSSLGAGAALAHAWFDDVLAARVTRARVLSDASARRKLAALSKHVERAAAAHADGDDRTRVVERLAGDAARLLDRRRRACDALVVETRTATLDVLRLAAAVMDRDRARGAGEVTARALIARARRLEETVRAELLDTRDRLRSWIGEAARTAGVPLDESVVRVDLTGLPELEVPDVLKTMSWTSSAFSRLWRGHTAEKLAEQCGAAVESALRSLTKALGIWARLAFARLGDQLESQIDPLRRR